MADLLEMGNGDVKKDKKTNGKDRSSEKNKLEKLDKVYNEMKNKNKKLKKEIAELKSDRETLRSIFAEF